MPSQAAQQVKLGFWVAAGVWIFVIVLGIFIMIALSALGKSR